MSALIGLFIIYGEASRLILDGIRNSMLLVVNNSEQFIDPDQVERFIDSKRDRFSPALRGISNELQAIRKSIEKSDINVEYVYLLTQDPDSHYELLFLNFDSKAEEEMIHFDELHPEHMQYPTDITASIVPIQIFSDQSGTWVSGYAPIFDKSGKRVAILGIDVRTEEIYLELEKLLLYGLIAFLISISIGVVFAYFLSTLVTSSLATLCKTVKRLGRGDLSHRSSLHTHDEFDELSVAINTMANGLEERERLKMGFTRYVSEHALEGILKQDRPIFLEGERKKVTLLFSDIRNFTSMAEKLPPEEVLKLLNEYFKVMIEVIFNYGGTLDKFIGDGVMVEFGAPLEDDEQELHAVLTAIDMQLHLERLSDKWEKEGKPRLKMGIGIHTGLAVLGNIGSERRMEYTAIGDTVNVASRLERLTKRVNKAIIISESVYEKVKDRFTFEDLSEVEIPGREEAIRAYSIDPFISKKKLS